MTKKRAKSGKAAPEVKKQPARAGYRLLKMPLLYGLLALSCLAIYGHTAGFNVTGLDDDTLMGAFAGHHYGIADAFARNAFMILHGPDFYRPLQSLVFMAASAVSGINPSAFHVANIALDLLAVAALFWLLQLLGFSLLLSFFLTLCFALSPIFAQAVAWIPGCGDLLLGLFGIISFGTFLKFREGRGYRFLPVHAAALFLAMLSKESGLVLPALFALWLLLTDRKDLLSRKNASLAAVWIVCGGIYLLLRHGAISGLPVKSVFGAGPLLGNLRALPESLAGLVACIDVPVMPSFTVAKTAIGIAAAAALVVVLALQGKLYRPRVAFGFLWFILLSVPGMLYTHELGSHAYDYLSHRAYLPMVGTFMLLGEAVPASWYQPKARRFLLAGSALAVLLAVLAWRQCGYFADPPAFYNQAIRTNPHSALALNNRGKLRMEGDEKQGAIQDFDDAIRIHPNYAMAYNNRGNDKGMLGDVPGAIADLTRAVAIDTAYALGYSNLGRWKAAVKDRQGALEDYGKAIRYAPAFAGVYNNRGALYGEMGDFTRAAADFQKSIEVDPLFSDAYVNLGRVRLNLNDIPGACALFRKAAGMGNKTGESLALQLCR